jgi:hypothetical protein
MNPLFRTPTASVMTEPPTRQVRRRRLTVEPLESRALLSIGYAAPGYPVAPATATSSPAALVAQAVRPRFTDSREVDLRHGVAD